jgi:uncharacterized protein HemX
MSKKQDSNGSAQIAEAEGGSQVGSAAQAIANTLGAHKGKLALGVAASLGLMVYYKWRERQLAKSDPEDYARLQRLKASVVHEMEGREKHAEHERHEEEVREEKEKPAFEPHVMRKMRKEKGSGTM